MKLKEKNRFVGVGMCVLVFLLLTTLPGEIHSGIPQKINYQGYLTDGQGVPVNGLVDMVFSIYSVPTGNKPLWFETQSVKVIDGVYNVMLGATVPFANFPNLHFDVPYYLGVKVGKDEEMVPRVALTSVAYAFQAQSVEAVPTHDHDAAYVKRGETNSVTSEMIADGAIASADISGPLFLLGSSPAMAVVGGSNSSTSPNGSTGVRGTATGTGAITNYGGSFEAFGNTGVGVYGLGRGTSGYGVFGRAYGGGGLGVYGEHSYVDYFSGERTTDNYGTLGSGDSGVYGHTNDMSGMGVHGYASNSGDVTNYGGYFEALGNSGVGVYGLASKIGDVTNHGGYFLALGDSGRGVFSVASGGAGTGVYGYANNTGYGTNYGGYFQALGSNGIGVYGGATNAGHDINYGGWFEAKGRLGKAVYGVATATEMADENYGGYFQAESDSGIGVYGKGGNRGGQFAGFVAGHFEGEYTGVHAKASETGVWGEASNPGGAAIKGVNSGGGYGVIGESWEDPYGTGVYRPGVEGRGSFIGVSASGGTTGIIASAANSGGIGLKAYGGPGGRAALFFGNVEIHKHGGNGSAPIILLGDGLDYAEGFDVSEPKKVDPGSVLIIDPENPGKLALSTMPYDTRVAGIVAGSKGLGSGVRLGAGQFDHNVALAGRVYCNVEATEGGIKPGDLLTTSIMPGYAMKATEYERAKGAILGKAMEALEQGKRGQILVLVTLQ